ncbi:MAG TPA: DUF2283 domain-containing protein [Azospirillaceae bacterium]|nr:DUF2283 domain-containing protein [Azospirillaceae bacterium]
MMTTSYDPEADAMFIRFGPDGAKAADTREVAPGILLDYDKDGNVIAIELLQVSRRAKADPAAAA